MKKNFLFLFLIILFFNFLFSQKNKIEKTTISLRQVAFELFYEDAEFFTENFLKLKEEDRENILNQVNQEIDELVKTAKQESPEDFYRYIAIKFNEKNGVKNSISIQVNKIISEYPELQEPEKTFFP